MQWKNMMLFLILTLSALLAGCVPQPSRPLILYSASPAQIAAVIIAKAGSEACGIGYNFYSVAGITELSVSLKSTPTTGINVLNFLAGSRPDECNMIWTMAARPGGITAVAVSSSLSTGKYQDFNDLENRFFAALDAQLQRVRTP